MEDGVGSTVEKVGAVLEALAGIGHPASLQELSEVLPYPKPTLRRLLLQLIGTRMVQQDSRSRRYRLGHRLVVLAAAVLDAMEVRKAATPFLYDLMERTRESTYLSVLDGLSVVYVEVAEAERSFRVITKVGTRRPAFLTASGRTMLAFEPEVERKKTLAALLRNVNAGLDVNPAHLAKHLNAIAANGYDVTADAATDITGVAAPVFDDAGACVASIAIAIPTHRFDEKKEAAMIREVVTAAAGLSDALRKRAGEAASA